MMSLINLQSLLILFQMNWFKVFAAEIGLCQCSNGNSMKNRTDGFAATSLEPSESGLASYIIFNCYGCYGKRLFLPRKHRAMIIEVAKDMGAEAGTRCRRFDINKTIPVCVSEAPKIMLRWNKLKRSQAMFSAAEWNNIFSFIARNRHAIKKHWLGEFDSIDLLRLVDKVNATLSD